MQTDLGARPAQLQFVVAAYGIGFGVFLITGGRLGEGRADWLDPDPTSWRSGLVIPLAERRAQRAAARRG